MIIGLLAIAGLASAQGLTGDDCPFLACPPFEGAPTYNDNGTIGATPESFSIIGPPLQAVHASIERAPTGFAVDLSLNIYLTVGYLFPAFWSPQAALHDFRDMSRQHLLCRNTSHIWSFFTIRNADSKSQSILATPAQRPTTWSSLRTSLARSHGQTQKFRTAPPARTPPPASSISKTLSLTRKIPSMSCGLLTAVFSLAP